MNSYSTIIILVEYLFNYFLLQKSFSQSKIKKGMTFTMSKNEFICDCNIIHQDIVNDTLKKMANETLFNNLADFFKILRRYN